MSDSLGRRASALASAVLSAGVTLSAIAAPDAGSARAPEFSQPSEPAATPEPTPAPTSPPAAASDPQPPAPPSPPPPPLPEATPPATAPPPYTPPVYTPPVYTPPVYTPPVYTPPAHAPAQQPIPPAGTSPPAPDEPDALRVREAHADRVLLVPTAYTHPEGTVYVSSYDIALLQAGWAISDTTQVSFTATPPLGEDAIFPLDLSLKTVIVQDGPLRIAGIGAVTGIVGLEEGNFLLGRGGAAVELCLDGDCESTMALATSVLFAGPATLAGSGVGVVWRVASWLALLAEVDTLLPLGNEIGAAHGILAGAGVRFPFRRVSVDLGFLRPYDVGGDVAALPIIAVTYRFLP